MGANYKTKTMFDEENPRQWWSQRKLLWGIRLMVVAVIAGIFYVSYKAWERVVDAHQRNLQAMEQNAMNRDVAQINLADSTSEEGKTENIRWVNLFLDDIIITSNHPHQLQVEEAPATKVESYVSPEDAPQGQGQQLNAGQGSTPPPHPRHRRTHDSDDDEDSTRHHRWSFRANLQGFKRVSLLAHYQLGNRWTLEWGLSYGHPKTGEFHNTCLGLPVTGFYKLVSKKKIEINALAGGMLEKVCKGNTSMQLLLRTGVDVEYKFSKKFSVFVEPSLRYHIGNDNNIPDLYGKRLGMNFSFGVSFRPW